MNLLKSLFIMLYPIIASAILFIGVYLTIYSGVTFGGTGAIFSAGGGLSFLAFIMTRTRARTAEHPLIITIISFCGLLMAIYGFITAEIHSNLFLAGAAIGTTGWFLYDYWYSKLDKKSAQLIKKGEQLPRFEVEENGKLISSDSFVGKKTLVLFYRGNWCPLCMAQIKEIATRYREITETGVQIILISPQDQKHTEKLAEKYNIPFRFMVDKGNQAAEKLNIAVRNGLPTGMQVLGYDSDTVLPTIIITDIEGKVIYIEIADNYRVRPEPDTFLRILNN